jgi:hypothetical protein
VKGGRRKCRKRQRTRTALYARAVLRVKPRRRAAWPIALRTADRVMFLDDGNEA